MCTLTSQTGTRVNSWPGERDTRRLQSRARGVASTGEWRCTTEAWCTTAHRATRLVHRSRWKDCEDRVRSLMVMGCGLMTVGVTPRNNWLSCLGATCPFVVAGPDRLEELV